MPSPPVPPVAVPVVFEAMIVPHRSLTARGRRILIGVLATLGLGSSAMFWMLGAWPVMGFSGAELGLAAYLLHRNAAGARASELLLLTEEGLRIIRTDPAGRRTERTLPPGWLNVELEDRPNRVPTLALVARGEREVVGASLGEDEKRDLARALASALDRWRHPRFDNPQLRA